VVASGRGAGQASHVMSAVHITMPSSAARAEQPALQRADSLPEAAVPEMNDSADERSLSLSESQIDDSRSISPVHTDASALSDDLEDLEQGGTSARVVTPPLRAVHAPPALLPPGSMMASHRITAGLSSSGSEQVPLLLTVLRVDDDVHRV